MTTAFKSNGEFVKHLGDQVDSESEALHQLMGGNRLFQDPSSHLTVGYGDVQQAAQILAFANMLLYLLDEAKL